MSRLRYVIHLNEFRFLLKYDQKNERTKRNDRINKTIMILNRIFKFSFARNVMKSHLRNWMQSFEKQICKRIILNRYFDDRENRIECESNEKFCEICQFSIRFVNQVHDLTWQNQFIYFDQFFFTTSTISFVSFVFIAKNTIFNFVVARQNVVFFSNIHSNIHSIGIEASVSIILVSEIRVR